MSVCTFFGHRDCPGSVKPRLREVLTELIVNYGVDTFSSEITAVLMGLSGLYCGN